jgi:hypothetical protein
VTRLAPLVVLLVGVNVAAAEAPKLVLLEAVGSQSDVDSLKTSFEEWLRPMQLELKMVPSLPTPEQQPSFARVRVVWTDDFCIVEVFRGAGELTRRKSLSRTAAPLLVSESAALIAQAGVQELSIEEAKQQSSLTPPPVIAAEVKAKEPSAAPDSGLQLGLAAFVQGRSYDATAPFVFGGGAELHGSLGSPGAWRPKASLLFSYQGPVTRQSDFVNFQLQALSIRLLPGIARTVGSFEFEAGAGGGFDVLIANTNSGEIPREFITRTRTDVAPFFSAALGARWHPSASSAIFVRALVDFDPARRRYRSTIAGETTTVLEPWGVRPAVQLGFSFDFISPRTP